MEKFMFLISMCECIVCKILKQKVVNKSQRRNIFGKTTQEAE